MASLQGQTIAGSYKDLLQVSNSNSGVDATARAVEDGEGTATLLYISTTEVYCPGTGGVGNEAVGYQALDIEEDGDFNTAIGHQSLSGQAGVSGTVGNTAVGYNSGLVVGAGVRNTIVGYLAGDGFDDESHNVFIGANAGGGSHHVAKSVAVGSGALYSAATVDGTTAVGHESLTDLTSGEGNTGVGYEAGKAISTASYNTAMGYEALQDLQTGNGANTAIGYKALAALPSGGNDNTAIGSNSMLVANNGSADQNTCVGSQSGKTITTGNKNTFIGNEAASSTFTTGTKCTIVGSESTTSSSGADNQISLGQGITGQADNTAIIGNSDVTAVYAAQDKDAIVYCGGVQFGAGTNQTALTDYEEGTWTGAFETSGGALTMGSAPGTFVRVGDAVHCCGYFSVTSLNGQSGSLKLTGLPFSIPDNTRNYGSVCVGYGSNLNITAQDSLTGYYIPNSDEIQIAIWTSSAGTDGFAASQLSADGSIMLNFTYFLN